MRPDIPIFRGLAQDEGWLAVFCGGGHKVTGRERVGLRKSVIARQSDFSEAAQQEEWLAVFRGGGRDQMHCS